MSISTVSSLLVAVLFWPIVESHADASKSGSSWMSITWATDGVPLTDEHPSLALAIKKEVRPGFLMEAQMVLGSTVYGLFEGKHSPRPNYGCLSSLIGILPGDQENVELATGVGVVAGQKEGTLYFNHTWENGLFPTRSHESRRLVFVDVGVPVVAQWRITRRKTTGLGLDFSCLFSRELFRWNLGISIQFGLGATVPRPASILPPPKIIPQDESPEGPVREELE